MVVGDPAAERRLSAASSPPRADWIVINAKSGLLAQTFVPTADLGLIDRYLYYRDLARGETAAGSEIACGSLLTGWERLSRGNRSFEPIMIALPGAHDAAALVKELNTAPVVGVRAAQFPRLKVDGGAEETEYQITDYAMTTVFMLTNSLMP